MLDYPSLFDDLAAIGLGAWRGRLERLLRERFADSAHGRIGEWRALLAALPEAAAVSASLNSDAVSIPLTADAPTDQLRSTLLKLAPWRKGPFDIGGVYIDSEWRSDMKWNRIRDAITPLDGRSVLDVGCGNGYYALRMRGAGASLVIGIDPTLLYVVQFLAIRRLMHPEPVHVLPLRLEDLPRDSNAFDSVFSMGVLYHRRSPHAHLSRLRSSLRSGGELVLETLILPGTENHARRPEGRYARMRNVWLLPTLPALESWLERAGFGDLQLIDVSQTSPCEQRSTAWMPFESLAQALDPADGSLTVEGWPAPRRAALTARRI